MILEDIQDYHNIAQTYTQISNKRIKYLVCDNHGRISESVIVRQRCQDLEMETDCLEIA